MNFSGDIARVQNALPLGRGVRVSAVGPHGLVALEKPADIKTHPNTSAADKDALLQARYDSRDECYYWAGNAGSAGEGAVQKLWLLNRLDAPTSGLVMAALTERAALAGRDCFAHGTAEKIYYAIVRGPLRPPQGIWHDKLARDSAGGKGVRVSAGQGLEAITRYEGRALSRLVAQAQLVRLVPQTGRTHQLRVQSALHHCPIAGDRTYGDFAWNKALIKATGLKRLFLHCAATRLSLKTQGLSGTFTAQCPPPEAFARLMGAPLSLGK